MPFYDLACNDCDHEFEACCAFKELKSQKCPECGSKKHEQIISSFSIGGPTAAKMGRFNYRAGYNYNKAQEERREAEAASHMGADPYQQPGIAIDDLHMDEGVHHPFPDKNKLA